jgi:hypothetical protein
MKQMKARKTRLKQPQNGIKLGLKLTPINKGNKTKEKHRNGRCLQRKNNMANMGNEASKRVSTFDMH